MTTAVELAEEDAVNKLWDYIFKTMRLDKDNPIAEWKNHIESLKRRSEILNNSNLKELHYKNSIGTDLSIGLPENYLFEGDIKINSVLEFETEELIIDAARRNLGIGYVVKPAVQYLVDANILEYIDIKEDLPGMEINLVYINSYLTNIAKIFIEEEISSDII